MKGIGKYINDLTRDMTSKVYHKEYTIKLSKKMTESIFIICKEKIKFNKEWIYGNKNNLKLINFIVKYAIERIPKEKEKNRYKIKEVLI